MKMFQVYCYNYHSSDLRVGSSEAPGRFNLSVNVDLNQFAYISKKKWGWAHPGFEIIVPLVSGELRNAEGIESDSSGLGDIWTGFIWQSDPTQITLGNTALPFFWRIVAGAFLPVGEYDHEEAFNPGCNFATFHVYYSNTIFLAPKWSLSSRFMYFHHTENTEYGPDKDDLTVGQLFNIHFSSAYEIFKGTRIGLMGHFWDQITHDELNGRDLSGKERLFAWGPGLMINKDVGKSSFFVETHALFDTVVENRPKGVTFQIRGGIIF